MSRRTINSSLTEHHVFDRQLGVRSKLNISSLCSSLKCVRQWNPKDTVDHQHHGGIFNFDFSEDGRVMLAACERRSLLVFDPYNGSIVGCRNDAHTDCVNCIRFLDNRTFATCSDDTTVCLWDIRFLKQKVRTLVGHTNWVKNIEFNRAEQLLLSSGFDGSIYSWKINQYTDDADTSQMEHILYTGGLLRSKLTPDGTKLIVSTISGYLMVIHDLDLSTLFSDLQGFRPNLYHITQQSRSHVSEVHRMNHVFTRSRNRVEIISDFPPENEAKMISSLEVHPQGWCVLSRNTSGENNSEWTCVHDIQGTAAEVNFIEMDNQPAEFGARRTWIFRSRSSPPHLEDAAGSVVNIEESVEPSAVPAHDIEHAPVATEDGDQHASEAGPSDEVQQSHRVSESVVRLVYVSNNTVDSDASDDEVAVVANSDAAPSGRQRVADATRFPTVRLVRLPSSSAFLIDALSGTPLRNRRIRRGSFFASYQPSSSSFGGSSNGTSSAAVPSSSSVKQDYKVCETKPRLSHYIEEANVGGGFIKEVAFSRDGRLVSSPFAFGIRLLAFDQQCGEICDSLPQQRPRELHEVAASMSHANYVVTTKFSPTDCRLVSGCLAGCVGFHQPVL